ncbi:MAG: hypothetical protein RL375_3397 [Pseudomonadota bacterium]
MDRRDPLRYQPERHETDALTQALQTAGLCLFIVLAIMVGSAIDNAHDAEIAAHQQRLADEIAAEQEAARIEGLRQAFEHGLDEGAERELFRQQQRLAAAEGSAP